MKLAVSYFYQIRNFKRNMIPISTAMWDPKWFHDNQGHQYIFFDKRGIINGIRANQFVPGKECQGLCGGRDVCKEQGPSACQFLKKYREQLEKIDFIQFLKDTAELVKKYKNMTGNFEEEPTVVFIVYEAPNNPCSERWVLLDYFRSKGLNFNELEYPIDKLEVKKGEFIF